jgi:hypothetical protein
VIRYDPPPIRLLHGESIDDRTQENSQSLKKDCQEERKKGSKEIRAEVREEGGKEIEQKEEREKGQQEDGGKETTRPKSAEEGRQETRSPKDHKKSGQEKNSAEAKPRQVQEHTIEEEPNQLGRTRSHPPNHDREATPRPDSHLRRPVLIEGPDLQQPGPSRPAQKTSAIAG